MAKAQHARGKLGNNVFSNFVFNIYCLVVFNSLGQKPMEMQQQQPPLVRAYSDLLIIMLLCHPPTIISLYQKPRQVGSFTGRRKNVLLC